MPRRCGNGEQLPLQKIIGGLVDPRRSAMVPLANAAEAATLNSVRCCAYQMQQRHQR